MGQNIALGSAKHWLIYALAERTGIYRTAEILMLIFLAYVMYTICGVQLV